MKEKMEQDREDKEVTLGGKPRRELSSEQGLLELGVWAEMVRSLYLCFLQFPHGGCPRRGRTSDKAPFSY